MTDFAHKVLVMTDIHITKEGRKIIGLDPMERFKAALDHALTNHPDAEALVITGDLTHHGIRDQYQRLKAVLDQVPIPVHLTLGNHDFRDQFVTNFPDVPRDPNGFVQSSFDVGDYKLILLDTHDPTVEPFHGGNICEKRLNWLEDQLSGQPKGSCVLMMHHPPFETGFPGMDVIGLSNRDALNKIIADSPAVAMSISGHVHRIIWGSAGGKPSANLKSTCHQMPLELVDDDSSLSIDEPGSYAILLLGKDGIVLINEDVGLDAYVTSDPDSV
ncbi:MAG: phosphodiesterase [Paracoccaceae bacterium]|nr:phosphodiesterase [Paracoccaceae bacterium]MDG2257283.1 phosphodiesterase [Paracoccaceae bacterium]